MLTESEGSALLSILKAWEKDGTSAETPWHITDLGWETYLHHPNPEIRKAAKENIHCGCPSKQLQQERLEYKLNVKAFA
jgi:hypothetical protein